MSVQSYTFRMKSWQKRLELILQLYFLEMLLYEILNKKSHHHGSLFDLASITNTITGSCNPSRVSHCIHAFICHDSRMMRLNKICTVIAEVPFVMIWIFKLFYFYIACGNPWQLFCCVASCGIFWVDFKLPGSVDSAYMERQIIKY